MALKLGANSINKLYLGSTAINKAYLGAGILFSGGFSPASLFAGGQQGLWLEVVKPGGLYPASLFAGGTEGAWYDPSDLSTLFQDSAGTTPVAASGQPVGLMLDKSGNGNHAVQTTSSKRPIYTEGSGLAWLAFDGVDDAMVTGAIDFTGTDKVSVFSGVRKLDDSSFGILYELSSNTNSSNGSLWASPGYSGRGSDSGAFWSASGKGTALQNATTSETFSAPQTVVQTHLVDISGDTITLRINGTQEAQTSDDLGTGNFGSYPLFIGARNQSSLYFKGNLYGLIIPGKAALADEIASTEAYMAAKSGVTL